MNDDFIVLVRDPAVLRSKGDKVVAIMSESKHKDKMCAAVRSNQMQCTSQCCPCQ